MPIASRRTGQDERAHLLAPEHRALIDDAFVRTCDLAEVHAGAAARGIAQALGFDRTATTAASVDAIVAACGLSAEIAPVPVRWLCEIGVAAGWMAREGSHYRYLADAATPSPESVEAEQAAHDPRALPSYRIVALAASHYPAVLRGEISAEDALFSRQSTEAWAEYFSNANPLYAINNSVGAMALEAALPAAGARVLEIGGGLGSAAEAVLARLGSRIGAYRFTEISVQFLRRARASLAAKHPNIGFAWQDIDNSLDAALLADGGYDAIYGVNVLHVAKDLAATLARLRDALKPGGALVVAECVRPFAGRPVYVELVFNLLAAFRKPTLHPQWRTTGGFLTPEEWRGALLANGFGEPAITPDIVRLREHYASFVVAAISARRT